MTQWTAIEALFGYALWTLALAMAIALHRGAGTVLGGRAPASFKPDTDELSAFGARLARAHVNCTQNLPVVVAFVVVASAVGAIERLDPLAPVLLTARLAQSAIHLTSTSNRAVSARFAFFVVQLAVLVVWATEIARALR